MCLNLNTYFSSIYLSCIKKETKKNQKKINSKQNKKVNLTSGSAVTYGFRDISPNDLETANIPTMN